jgi:Lysine-specific metallo-endopeptidase
MGFAFLNNTDVQLLVQPLTSPLMSALEEAAKRVDNGQANAACARWFGDTSAAFKKDLARDLRRMRSAINVKSITVGFMELDQRDVDTNAAAWNDKQRHVDLGDSFNHTGTNAFGQKRAMVYINLGFRGMPTYLQRLGDGTIDAADGYQSKFETLVHELSHFLLGTRDKKLTSGNAAYGAKRAVKLVAQDPAKAKSNAENWGIFVEAVGVHKAS